MNIGIFARRSAITMSVAVIGINTLTNKTSTGLGLDYILIFLFMILMFPLLVFKLYSRGSTIPKKWVGWMLIAGAVISVWIYSIIVGLVLGNRSDYIFRNNAGIIAYFLFFYFVLFLDKIVAIKILKTGGFILLFLTLILKVLESLIGFDLQSGTSQQIFGRIVGDGGVRFGRIFIYAQFLVCVPILYSAFSFLEKKSSWQKKLFKLFCIVTGIYVMTLVSQSKGMLLALSCSFLFALLVYSAGKSSIAITRLSVLSVLFSLSVVYLTIAPSDINPLAKIFSGNDISNVARYEQVSYLTNQFTVIGRGSGAVIPGYNRDSKLEYGFELSYLAIIHKFGAFAAIIIFGYVVTLLSIVVNTRRGSLSQIDAVILGSSMSFLLPAIGNPGLFSVQEVTCHCLVMLVIAKSSKTLSTSNINMSLIGHKYNLP